MAVYTQLTKVEIDKLLEGYNLGSLVNFKGINEGIENTNYLIATNKGKFVLTIFENRVKNSNLPFFLKLMNHSKKFGVECPEPVEDIKGNFINSIESKKFSIFTFLDGCSKKRWSSEICFKVGKTLANFHKINKNLKLRIKNDFSVNYWEKLISSIKNKKYLKENFLNNEFIYIKNNWPKKLPSGIIHADLFPDNVFFKNGNISGILDFYFSCFDFFIYDLAILINAWCFNNGVFQKKKFLSLVSGYESIRPLEKNEVKSINIILRGASLIFLLTRIIDAEKNDNKKIIVKKKDPNEFYKILKHHISIENDFNSKYSK